MLKIWVKTLIDGKIIRQKTLKMIEPYSRELIEYMTRTVLEQMDIPAPVFLNCHFFNFENFRNMRFLKRDFVETVEFDQLEVVDITE